MHRVSLPLRKVKGHGCSEGQCPLDRGTMDADGQNQQKELRCCNGLVKVQTLQWSLQRAEQEVLT